MLYTSSTRHSMLVLFNKRLTPPPTSHPQEPFQGGRSWAAWPFASLTWGWPAFFPCLCLDLANLSKMLSTPLLGGMEMKAGACVHPAGSPPSLITAPGPATLVHTPPVRDSRNCQPHTGTPAKEQRRHVHVADDISIWLLVECFVSDPWGKGIR